MKHAFWIALLLLFPAIVIGQQSASVSLAGFNHVPPVKSPGSGTLTVINHGDTLFVEGEFQDLGGDYRSASIHYGSSRESGNRLLGLTVQVDQNRKGGTLIAEDNTFVLRQSLLEALEEGNLYINIASSRHQNGEIRGQIPSLTDGRWRTYVWD